MRTQYLDQSRPKPQAARRTFRTTLLDNDEVVVNAGHYPPGASESMHTHRFPSVVYVIEGGTLEITGPDGTVERYDMRPEETLWSGAAHSHSVRNIGSTPVRLVEIEVKHASPSAKDTGSERGGARRQRLARTTPVAKQTRGLSGPGKVSTRRH